jgi:hypothetical protein
VPKQAATKSNTSSKHEQESLRRSAATTLELLTGKVNQVVTELAQHAPDVVLGMFHANSNPATVLFDSSAAHSFIPTQIVARYKMPIVLMKNKLLVTSRGGEM